jgi:hypothetical protein
MKTAIPDMEIFRLIGNLRDSKPFVHGFHGKDGFTRIFSGFFRANPGNPRNPCTESRQLPESQFLSADCHDFRRFSLQSA